MARNTPIQSRGRSKLGRIFVEHGKVIETGSCFGVMQT
jgi:hypothetical protein